MDMKPDRMRASDDLSDTPAQRGYRVWLSAETGKRTERLIRRLIQHKRGDLLAIERCGVRQARVHLRLGARRIHDVITSLEAAGFAVSALVAT